MNGEQIILEILKINIILQYVFEMQEGMVEVEILIDIPKIKYM